MLQRYNKAPWPWFGGKAHAAPTVWTLLGDVMHYVEPFMGTMAVLLERPHPCNRPYHSETVADSDGLLCNAWRAIQWYPEATAAAASWPVSELDKTARQIALLKWQNEKITDLLAGSATWCDLQMAGWWLYAVCCQIGAFDGRAPWTADPVTGRIVKVQGLGEGVFRNRPDLAQNGRGVNHAGLREPGVSRDLPHLGDDGKGVHRPQLREPGVRRNLPHLGDDGKGVHRPQLREPGVSRDLPHLGHDGKGVNTAACREPGVGDDPEFHPMTMPELIRWFQWLSARLRHVRIVNGDWARVCTPGARLTLPVRQGHGYCGVFMDPPYDATTRDPTIYRQEVTHDLHRRLVDWCLDAQHDPKTRIVVAGYAGAYPALEAAGWTVHPWYAAGYLRGGYGNIDGTSQQAQERLWASPSCLPLETTAQLGLFGEGPVAMPHAAQGAEDGAYSAG